MENAEQPSIKRRRIEMENNELNRLPDWVLGKIIRALSVTERLRLDRIDWHWNQTIWEFGWTEQKKLGYEVVFDGAERVNRDAFTNESLVALFKRVGKHLIELDVHSFLANELSITEEVCDSLHRLPNLSSINIVYFDLSRVLPFLPVNLRELQADRTLNEETLSALAIRCPNLEAIAFADSIHSAQHRTSLSTMNDFLLKYPNLKKLDLSCRFVEGSGILTAIGAMHNLEEFLLCSDDTGATDCMDEGAFGAMIDGCKRLRRLTISPYLSFSEASFCKLASLSNLVELVLPADVTDFTVMGVSKCPNLKKLDVSWCEDLTDDSVVYLVKHCKSLVALNVKGCEQITERSLVAVMAEVNNRHGNPPRALPKGPADKQIFNFRCDETAIDWDDALNVTANNPWLCLEHTEELENRSF